MTRAHSSFCVPPEGGTCCLWESGPAVECFKKKHFNVKSPNIKISDLIQVVRLLCGPKKRHLRDGLG